MSESWAYAGIDVSKAELETAWRVPDDVEGIEAQRDRLDGLRGAPTGFWLDPIALSHKR